MKVQNIASLLPTWEIPSKFWVAGPALAVAGIWGVKQWMEDVCVSIKMMSL